MPFSHLPRKLGTKTILRLLRNHRSFLNINYTKTSLSSSSTRLRRPLHERPSTSHENIIISRPPTVENGSEDENVIVAQRVLEQSSNFKRENKKWYRIGIFAAIFLGPLAPFGACFIDWKYTKSFYMGYLTTSVVILAVMFVFSFILPTVLILLNAINSGGDSRVAEHKDIK